MKKTTDMVTNERGSLLVIALIVLMMLTLIGIAITTTASLELQIAGNDRLHKTAFYKADGGTEIGYQLLEQNLGCASGFSTDEITGSGSTQTVKVVNTAFWQNLDADIPDETLTDTGDPSFVHFFFPSGYTAEHAPIPILPWAATPICLRAAPSRWSAATRARARAPAPAGRTFCMTCTPSTSGVVNSQSIIKVQWRHVIGQEGACNY